MSLGPYYDPLGEFEPSTTRYKLTVFTPPRPYPKWSISGYIRKNWCSDLKENWEEKDLTLSAKDLQYMETKPVTIKSAWFPWQMRCKHVQADDGAGKGVNMCNMGCYVLEKGVGAQEWRCAREDCEGHLYSEDEVVKDENGRSCFGKKGERMVLMRRKEMQ